MNILCQMSLYCQYCFCVIVDVTSNLCYMLTVPPKTQKPGFVSKLKTGSQMKKKAELTSTDSAKPNKALNRMKVKTRSQMKRKAKATLTDSAKPKEALYLVKVKTRSQKVKKARLTSTDSANQRKR